MFKVGDKFYTVWEKVSGTTRNKILMVDDEGIEWYRHEEPIRSYRIEEWTVVGRSTFNLEGELVPCDRFPTGPVLYCHSSGVDTDACPEEDLKTWIDSAEYYFKTAEEAQSGIDALLLKEKHIKYA
jgi:hypothetical protein